MLVGRLELVAIEAVRPQLAFDADPSGRGMRMIQVGALAVESLAPVLLFEGAARQTDVRLSGNRSFLERIHFFSS